MYDWYRDHGGKFKWHQVMKVRLEYTKPNSSTFYRTTYAYRVKPELYTKCPAAEKGYPRNKGDEAFNMVMANMQMAPYSGIVLAPEAVEHAKVVYNDQTFRRFTECETLQTIRLSVHEENGVRSASGKLEGRIALDYAMRL